MNAYLKNRFEVHEYFKVLFNVAASVIRRKNESIKISFYRFDVSM